jgi:hypothetical protein
MIAVATMRKITPGYLYHNYLIDALKLHREITTKHRQPRHPSAELKTPFSPFRYLNPPISPLGSSPCP